MQRIIFLLLFAAGFLSASAQELYVYTEPASNMPSNTLSTKLTTVLGNRKSIRGVQQRYIPEVMLGINKNLMLHAAATFSNMATPGVTWEGVYAYGKYRFLSKDGIHRHFRMAAFAEAGYSRNPMMFDEISIQGDMSGVQGGLIATQLVNRLALSGTASFTRLLHTGKAHPYHVGMPEKALSYSLSAGYLVFPREYTDYRQLNFNVYTEFLGQRGLGTDKWFIDAAPAVQFIINSNSKVNLGYRFQLGGTAYRSYTDSYLVSFEHTFFRAFKR